MKRRFLSFALAIAMCISMVPASVLASAPEDVNTDTAESKTETTNDEEETNIEGENTNDKEETNLEGKDTNNNADGPVLLTNAEPQTAAADEVAIDEENFPDPVFREYVNEFDTDKNGSFSQAELDAVKTLEYSTISMEVTETIKSAKGVEYFTEITSLNFSGNEITEINLSKNTALTALNLMFNKISEIDLSKNTALTSLNLGQNILTKLDLSKNTAIDNLALTGNKLSEIDVSKQPKLYRFFIAKNQLTSIDVSSNTELTDFACAENKLTELDVSKNKKLDRLDCHSNEITSLDLKSNTMINTLIIYKTQITEIDASDFSEESLYQIDADFNTKDMKITINKNGIGKNKFYSNSYPLEISSDVIVTGGKLENDKFVFDENSNTMTFKYGEHTITLNKAIEKTANVTFKVKNGTWSDGSTADKVVEVTLTNGKGKLTNEQIPTGMKTDEYHEGGKWYLKNSTNGISPKTPYEEEITGDCVFIYGFSTKKILEATPDSLVGGGKVVLKADRDYLKCDDESIKNLKEYYGKDGYKYFEVELPDVTKDYIFTSCYDGSFMSETLTVTVHVRKSGETDPERPRPTPDHNDDDDDEDESIKKPVIVKPSVVITPSMNPPTGSML